MISRLDLEERVREWGLREGVVEKDYVLGWVLWGIGSHPLLAKSWAFKGGTCLKKCYIETYRFSEDLDFTVLPGGPISQADVGPILDEILPRITEESGIDFSGRPVLLKTHESGMYTEGRIYYRGPRNAPQVARIKLDLMASEVVARPTVLRPIAHSYPDELPDPASVRCYCFPEVFAEKIRAMGERVRPRDLYDIINLYRRPDLQDEPHVIREVLVEKCDTKGVPVPTLASIDASPYRPELESEWANMLAHQLPALPPFETFWGELPSLFEWLEETRVAPERQPVATAANEMSSAEWALPPTIRAWGVGVPLETVRFAAANHLCIELGYDGSRRVVEPYSLRRTRDGNLILHAIRADNRGHRAYRIDRIQSITVTSQPFTPVYKIEFSGSGPIHAPATKRSDSSPRRRNRPYTLECHYCGRKFPRSTRTTTLRRHNDANGYPCAGRRGYLI